MLVPKHQKGNRIDVLCSIGARQIVTFIMEQEKQEGEIQRIKVDCVADGLGLWVLTELLHFHFEFGYVHNLIVILGKSVHIAVHLTKMQIIRLLLVNQNPEL